MSSRLTCRICDTSFMDERAVKRHARKVHDCTLFVALNPQYYPDNRHEGATQSDLNTIDALRLEGEYPPLNAHLRNPDGSLKGNNAIERWESRQEEKALEKADTAPVKTIRTQSPNKPAAPATEPKPEVSKTPQIQVVKPPEKKVRPKKPTLVFSFSQVAQFLDCEQAWKYSYIDQIKPRIESPKLTNGTLVHLGIEKAWYKVLELKKANPKIEPKEMFPQVNATIKEAITGHFYQYLDDNQDLLDEEVEASTHTAQNALDVCKRAFRKIYAKFEPLLVEDIPAIEYQFKVPLQKMGVFSGRIDFIAKERTSGLLWLVDWKVRESFQLTEYQEYNLQMAAYQYALMLLGIKTAGSMVFQIFAKPPSKPEFLKPKKLNKEDKAAYLKCCSEDPLQVSNDWPNVDLVEGIPHYKAEMSRALIKTDWKTYEKALLQAGLDPNNYQDMKEKLKDVEFYRESRAYRNELEIKNTWNCIIIPAITRMVKYLGDLEKGKYEPIRTLTSKPMGCYSCKFNRLCMEELRGRDTQFILDNEFIHNDYVDRYKEDDE